MAFSKPVAALGLILGIAAAGAVAAYAADAPTRSPGATAAFKRHENFRQQGAVWKAIVEELHKDAPNAATLAPDAAKLKASALALPTWFPKGSGPESGFATRAKAEIWSDPKGFADAAARFQAESGKLQQLAAAGDMTGAKAQARAVGGACKNCHDTYRGPEIK